MVFSSLLFLFVYLPIVLAVYFISPRKWRNPALFVANLIFYGWGEPVYVLLMVFSIALNYFSGIIIHKYREDKKKAKSALVFNVVVNLAMLGFFKYYNLFAETINLLPFISLPELNITLPIGISFYTFQTMSYTIDVYREQTDVQYNFISFGTFVALFPQLIAGPIVRYKDVASQLDFRPESIEKMSSGVRRFAVGLGKKVLLANNIGLLWDIYSQTTSTELTVLGSWIGVCAFALQIYFDFSGYSDMAIGLGRLIGFEFLENFNYPYISESITEFWRRWHMSLGTWFRDYVYIPLGGNRMGAKRQLMNILIVWSLTGLWHGASWTFVLWGLYYGILITMEKFFLMRLLGKCPAFLRHFYTIFAVFIAWPLFQLNSLGDATTYISAMLGFSSAGLAVPSDIFYLKAFLVIFLVSSLACTPLPNNLFMRIPSKVRKILTPILVFAVLIVSTAYLVDSTYNPFLYFRF